MSQPDSGENATRFDKVSRSVVTALGIFLCFFTLVEVNYNLMQPQASLAVFVGVGLVLCFLTFPLHKRLAHVQALRWLDVVFAIASAASCLYMIVQTEPLFQRYWLDGMSLGNRAGVIKPLDFWVGLVGLILVLEATRRSIGLVVPLLAMAFIAHTYYCYGSNEYGWIAMPDWMFPHSGGSVERIVSTTYLQSIGVFGQAAKVMFRYVFLFVVFGSFLEMAGATQFIVDFATKTVGRFRGGPALVSVIASGLMGSLSGSAVANAVTTGTFTIPMMRSARFPKHIAGGITAAAASGGALVPPVMGAGAYMMLDLIPDMKFPMIMKAAAIPASLYYLSILVLVFLYSRRLGASGIKTGDGEKTKLSWLDATVFFCALGVLIRLLAMGSSVNRSVSAALATILVFATLRRSLNISKAARWMAFASFFVVLALHQATGGLREMVPSWLEVFMAETWIDARTQEVSERLLTESISNSSIMGMFGILVFGLFHRAWRPEMVKALTKSAKNGIALVSASACVGIIIGIVQETGIATDFSAAIKSVVETNLFLALVGIMVCSLILGMGVPSVVCYLLMATLMGSLLGELGVQPLIAHLFIFYFGMMSMVTPPVALAGYASASIAEAPIMKTSFAAFRFSLVGFTLPFMFVYRPALCLLAPDGGALDAFAVTHAIIAATIGVFALATGLANCWRSALSIFERIATFASAALLLAPISKIGEIEVGLGVDIFGAALFFVAVFVNSLRKPSSEPSPEVENELAEASDP